MEISELLGVSAAILLLACGALELRLRSLGHKPYVLPDCWIDVQPGGRLVQAHPELGYRYRAGAYTVTLYEKFCFRMTHDLDTLRITGPSQGPDRRREVWIFGCSLAHGWSLNDEETFPWLLQREFPESRIVNFGVGGYGTLQSLIQFRAALESRDRPALCLLAYSSLHDSRNSFSRSRRKQVVPHDRKLGPFSQPVARLDRERGLTWTMSALAYREFPLMRRSALVHYLEKAWNDLEDRQLRGPELSRRLIEEFQQRAAASEVPFVLVGITGSAGTHDTLRYAAARGISTFDASVDTSRTGYNNLPFDGHPSAKANREVAQLLIGFLRAKVAGFGWS